MLSWCMDLGATGWVLMVALWGTFVALAIWAISRLIPVAPVEAIDPAQGTSRLVQEVTPDRGTPAAGAGHDTRAMRLPTRTSTTLTREAEKR